MYPKCILINCLVKQTLYHKDKVQYFTSKMNFTRVCKINETLKTV